MGCEKCSNPSLFFFALLALISHRFKCGPKSAKNLHKPYKYDQPHYVILHILSRIWNSVHLEPASVDTSKSSRAQAYSSFLTVVWGLPQPLGCNVSNAPTMGGQGSGPWGLIGYTTIDQRSAPWCLLLLGLLILRNSCMHRKWGVKNVPHKSTTLHIGSAAAAYRRTTTIIYLFFYTSNFFRVWFR